MSLLRLLLVDHVHIVLFGQTHRVDTMSDWLDWRSLLFTLGLSLSMRNLRMVLQQEGCPISDPLG
jgi:hypothetical protein